MRILYSSNYLSIFVLFVLLLKCLPWNILETYIITKWTLFIKQLWVLLKLCHVSPKIQTQFAKLSFRTKENYILILGELVQWLNLDKITSWYFPSPFPPPHDMNALTILWKFMSCIVVLDIRLNKLLLKRLLNLSW